MSNYHFEDELRAAPEFLACLRLDKTFAHALYCALENQAWGGDGKQTFTCSFRYAGGLVAELRELGEGYMDFYCGWGPDSSWSCTIQPMVAEELAKLGWYPVEYPDESD